MQIVSPTFYNSVYNIIDSLQERGISKNVFKNNKKASIYGGDSCLEISPMINIIEDPLQMFPVIPGRGNHFTMQLAELIWVLQGKTNTNEFFAQFASPAIRKFSHNTNKLYAAYGHRIRNQPEGHDILQYAIKTLEENINSRSAVIPIFNAELDTMGGEHKPCATTFQVHQYNNKLDGILTLRANDLIKGYSAINFLEFAFIQAIICFCLDQKVGRFINFTTTMHYYEGKASDRIEQIKKYRDLKIPSTNIGIKDLFDQNVKKEERYTSILEDVNNIYTSLKEQKINQQNIHLIHPVFKNIFEILKTVKFNLPITEAVKKLPDYFLYPYLENQYRNNKKEVEQIIKSSKKISKYKKSITWRDNQ